MNGQRGVWLQDAPSSLPHFRTLGTLPRSFRVVRAVEDADVIVASVDYLLGLPAANTTKAVLVAVDAYGADPDAIVALGERTERLRIGEPAAIALSRPLTQLRESVRAAVPTFVEVIVQQDREMTPVRRLAEMLGITAALGMPPATAWARSVTGSAIAIAGELGSTAVAATHRTSALEPAAVEVSVTAEAERRTAYVPIDGSAKPTQISVQSGTGQWHERPVYASPLREFWRAEEYTNVNDVLSAVEQARSML